MMHLVIILLTLSGVLTQSSNWTVFYPESLCAVRGFSATIPCNYSYPPNLQVVEMTWSSERPNQICHSVSPVYNSKSNVTSDFVYGGDDKSNCTLVIQNVKFNYSKQYCFTFITNLTTGKWTGRFGVTLQVADLKVELIRLSGNGTLKPGDSLNLTCHVNCTNSSSQIVWSKNNQHLDRSGPVLHFPALTVGDSGNYTCTWRTNMAWGSKTIGLLVEGGPISSGENSNRWVFWISTLLIVGVLIILVMVAVYYKKRRKVEAPEENNGQREVKTQVGGNLHMSQLNQDPRPSNAGMYEPEVTYSTLSIKNTRPTATEKTVRSDLQEDASVIYSDVKLH
ncbi:uncharacterized protein LOC134301215 [Trichomycterus rosablanca]|uniref:uncharacterized protein LOC134301215 n=1 Tax=Trichomycterus rosablanca TaxID=2290929 RepID=UPI002F354D08